LLKKDIEGIKDIESMGEIKEIEGIKRRKDLISLIFLIPCSTRYPRCP